MSHNDTTVAQMTALHALWAIKVKTALAFITFQRDRLVVLQEHRRIIETRYARLGKKR